ncbi:GNAT family N-acetyltransferase [Streptomyces sp. ST2-7A]|uniref:GNAT family N-acetyltransferase n=1 Tax=Streptomyces sp. ST2-7A TaxID=2907214 RepID=UPI001F41E969|nr:GNAT family N-acetyltransferase [Streptomyces sp. ST2-7A]MCE7079062.1 GNAT family N-acetyltransferase [Streptomyces sp. ST2-7A]
MSPDTTGIVTPRLVLRRPVIGDIDTLLALHRDPRACEHNPSDILTDRDAAISRYIEWDRCWRVFGHGYRAVRLLDDPGGVIGFCGLKPSRVAGVPVLNLFYRFLPTHWGRGLGGEAAVASVEWGSARMPRLPITARIRPANVASRRVALRAGLVRTPHADPTGPDGPEELYVLDRAGRLAAPHPDGPPPGE